ncbi:hypothetical protein D3C71_1019410 [compost metagenome]
MRHIASGGTGNDPAQHIGVDGFVGKRLAVLALWLHRLQKLVVTARAVITLGFWHRAACPGMGPDLGIRVRVVLAVFEARRHVEHLPYRGATKRGVLQLRYIFVNPFASIDTPLRHQHGAQRADHRLGHRHRGVLTVRLQHSEITLVDDLPAVHHHNAIGVGSRQGLLPGHRQLGTKGDETDRVDVVAQRGYQGNRRTKPTRNIDRRHQLPEIRDAPAHCRKPEIAAVFKTHSAISGRWRPDHPAQPGGVAGFGVGKGCRSGSEGQ